MDAKGWKLGCLEVGGWKLEAGNWKLEVGSWKLETGIFSNSNLRLTSNLLHLTASLHPLHFRTIQFWNPIEQFHRLLKNFIRFIHNWV